WTVVAREGSAVDTEITRAVVQGHAGAAIVLGAAARPAQRTRDTASRAVREIGAAPRITVHPRIGNHALEHAALHAEPVAADTLDGHVVDGPVVGPAIVAVGDDLDAVAFAA